jgi:signal peptidase II
MKKFPYIEFTSFAIALFLDQLTKILVAYTIPFGQSVPVIPGIVYLTTVHNTGTIWGLGQGGNLIFAFLAIAVVVLIIIFAPTIAKTTPAKIALGAILGGAIGNNVIDRFARGYVIDFIDFRWFPVFNVADIGIVCGAITIGLMMLFTKDNN